MLLEEQLQHEGSRLTTSWQPIVESADRRRELAAVAVDIHDALSARTLAPSDHLDVALLRAYLARAELVDDDRVASSLSAAIANAGRGGAGLLGGLAGTAWVLAHVASGDAVSDICISIEQALLQHLDRGSIPAFDLVSGVAGLGVLALERIDTPTGRELASRVIDHLERLATPALDGLGWHTPPDQLFDEHRADAPDGYWNLGVAHGTPGVIAVLARFIAAGVETERATRLCDAAVHWLLAVAPVPSSGDRFRVWHPTPPNKPSRVAWCYGDLGVSLALLAAARARGRDDWRDDAIVLARDVASRSFEASNVQDAALCHGAAGNAHLFNRLYAATGEIELATAARRWLDHALELRRPDGIAGFAACLESGWTPAVDLLTGATGVALALLAAATDVEPAWDRLLVADL